MSNYPDNMDWSQIDGPEDDRCFHSIGTHYGEQVRAVLTKFLVELADLADPDEGFHFDKNEGKWLEAAAIDAFSFDGDDEGYALKAFQNACDPPRPVAPASSLFALAAAIVSPTVSQ